MSFASMLETNVVLKHETSCTQKSQSKTQDGPVSYNITLHVDNLSNSIQHKIHIKWYSEVVAPSVKIFAELLQWFI